MFVISNVPAIASLNSTVITSNDATASVGVTPTTVRGATKFTFNEPSVELIAEWSLRRVSKPSGM